MQRALVAAGFRTWHRHGQSDLLWLRHCASGIQPGSQQERDSQAASKKPPQPSLQLQQTCRGRIVSFVPGKGLLTPIHLNPRVQELPLTPKTLFKSAYDVMGGFLLPAGHLEGTVGPGYHHFVFWQFLANLFGSITGVVGSSFLLYAVNMSAAGTLASSAAIPTAGAINWVLKDGLGNLGSLLFGRVVAHNFDIHSKTWFFLSMLILCAASGIEIMTSLAPAHFVLLGSFANGIKGLSWMASGSTRSVFNLSFCRDNNVADVTAKSTSQSICAGMFGTLFGAVITSLVGQDVLRAMGAYVAFSSLTLFAAYKSVTHVPLQTVNSTRLQLLCESFLENISKNKAQQKLDRDQAELLRNPASKFTPQYPQEASEGPPGVENPQGTAWGVDIPADDRDFSRGGGKGKGAPDSKCVESQFDGDISQSEVPNPCQLAPIDPPLPFIIGDKRLLDPAIVVGDSIERILEGAGPELLIMLLSTYRLGHAIVLPRGPAVHILLHTSATNRDIIQAYLQACLLRRRMRSGSVVGYAVHQHVAQMQQAIQDEALGEKPSKLHAVQEQMSLTELRIVLQDTLLLAERLTTNLMRALGRAGWQLDKVAVEAEKKRGHW